MVNRLLAFLNTWVERMALLGAVVVLIQAFWITYGVFVRYVLNSPDRMVTEATALLLVPVAFIGLAFALKEDAYPKVSFLLDALSAKHRRILEVFNLLVMGSVGAFLSIATVSASFRAVSSGAASEILLWPRYLFWFPVALSLCVFTLYAFLKAWITACSETDSQQNLETN